MNQQKEAAPSYEEATKAINDRADKYPSEIQKTILDEIDKSTSQHNAHGLPLKIGDKAPNFLLKNAIGKEVQLTDLLKENKVVLTFYRGTWCPYCNLHLTQFQEVVFKLKSIGSTMLAVSPQNPDESLNMKEKNDLSFEVLSDPGNKVAKAYTSVVKSSNEYVDLVSNGAGKAFKDHYSDESNEVPVPAVFIIEKDATISFAKSEGGDYRKRVEVKKVLDALDS